MLRYVVIFILTLSSIHVSADQALTETNLKTRFIHQFIIFTEWPKSIIPNNDSPFKVGIIGDQTIVDLYRNMKNTDIGEHKMIIDHLDEKSSKEKLSEYHVLFIRKNHQKIMPNILEKVAGLPIISITESDTDSSAMINFIMIDRKLRFAIDEAQAKSVGIKFRSQLLRLAIAKT